ncbi:MAG TPA: oligosaccharide flippase family protein [Candidatus Saccharimonadales bacterium]|nr:oligosaccharide flippase family protein [Candidatus Saccharimonadales bacterium]
MEELDIAAVTKRSIHGVFALVTRTFFIQVVSFTVNFLLTVFLAPSIFGVYFVVSAVIAFLQYFSDIGLAAALIQKKEAMTQEDLVTTFTIQQGLVLLAVIIALSLSQVVGNFYHLEQEGIFLFQALIISFFLSSLKTIPSIILERDLHFERLVVPQIVETLFFNITALVFAVKGFGVTSFTYAVLARGLAGLIAMYIVSPWRPRIGFSKEVAKKLLSFGIPFQANSFLALLKDDLMIAYIGKVLPLAQVGYIGFAQKWAYTPLRLIMDNIIRITFPSFARLQHEKSHLAKAIEKSLFASCFLVFPSLMGLAVLAPSFIEIIPKYQKWEPAVLSLAFFAMNAALSSVSTPLTNALNAIGKIKVSLYLMVFWTVATWVLTPLALYFYGFNAFAAVSAIVAASVVFVVYLTQKYIPFSIKIVFPPFIATILMGIILYGINHVLPASFVTIFGSIILGSLVYLLFSYLLAKEEVVKDMLLIKQQFIK